MKIGLEFRSGVEEEIEFPDKNLLFYAKPIKTINTPDEEKNIVDSLNNPIGTGKLNNLLKNNMSVVVLIDDITRPTPTAKILPHLVEIIRKSGVPDSKLKFITAPGTHKILTDGELKIKLGKDFLKRYKILNVDYRDESKFINIGTTKNGIPIEIIKEVVEADFVIGIGNIIPHISAGWSGGGKIILPGVCSGKTTDMMHYIACTVQPVLEILGTVNNIPRLNIEEAAKKAGLNFIINTVLDECNNIQGIFCGDPIKAHHKGAEFAEKIMIVPIPKKADILVVSANPCHFDYWQGIKPYAYSHRAVRDGGVLIFLLDGEQHLCGDAPSHETTLRKYMLYNLVDMIKDVENGIAIDIVGMNVPMYHSMLRHRVKNFIVSNHLTEEEINILGFERMPSVQKALDYSFRLLGKDASLGIIPFGGETLTRVDPIGYAKLIEKSSIFE